MIISREERQRWCVAQCAVIVAAGPASGAGRLADYGRTGGPASALFHHVLSPDHLGLQPRLARAAEEGNPQLPGTGGVFEEGRGVVVSLI